MTDHFMFGISKTSLAFAVIVYALLVGWVLRSWLDGWLKVKSRIRLRKSADKFAKEMEEKHGIKHEVHYEWKCDKCGLGIHESEIIKHMELHGVIKENWVAKAKEFSA